MKLCLDTCVCVRCSHCENNTLSCEGCPPLGSLTTPAPAPGLTTPSALLLSTVMPENNCDRAMDLAFLLDGSTSLSEEDFEALKLFILGVVDRFRMGSAHTRATVLLYHSGVKTYGMQVHTHKAVQAHVNILTVQSSVYTHTQAQYGKTRTHTPFWPSPQTPLSFSLLCYRSRSGCLRRP